MRSHMVRYCFVDTLTKQYLRKKKRVNMSRAADMGSYTMQRAEREGAHI